MNLHDSDDIHRPLSAQNEMTLPLSPVEEGQQRLLDSPDQVETLLREFLLDFVGMDVRGL